MISDVLQSISGIEVFPVFALIFSMVLFLYLSLRIFRMDRNERDRVKHLPLDSDTPGRTMLEDRHGAR